MRSGASEGLHVKSSQDTDNILVIQALEDFHLTPHAILVSLDFLLRDNFKGDLHGHTSIAAMSATLAIFCGRLGQTGRAQERGGTGASLRAAHRRFTRDRGAFHGDCIMRDSGSTSLGNGDLARGYMPCCMLRIRTRVEPNGRQFWVRRRERTG